MTRVKCKCSVTGKDFETTNDMWTKCPYCSVIFNVQTGQQFGKPAVKKDDADD